MATQRVKAEIAKAKAQHGGKREGSGRPVGIRVSPITRERIRGGMLVARLEAIAEGKAKDSEPHHVTAALGLLRKVLPDLAQTDVTSGGLPLTVERVVFTPSTGASNVPQAPRREDDDPTRI